MSEPDPLHLGGSGPLRSSGRSTSGVSRDEEGPALCDGRVGLMGGSTGGSSGALTGGSAGITTLSFGNLFSFSVFGWGTIGSAGSSGSSSQDSKASS